MIINVGPHIKYSYQILIKLGISREIFEIYSNTKFHENPSSASRIFPCGQTDRQTCMTKLITSFSQTSWLHRASNNVETLLLPTDANNVKKHRVTKTF